MIPAKIFMDIGLYNEKSLPHYRADYELVYHAKKKGYDAFVSGNSIVYTGVNESSKLKGKNIYVNLRENMLKLILN